MKLIILTLTFTIYSQIEFVPQSVDHELCILESLGCLLVMQVSEP